ncbi:GAF domain-containing protein [Flavobacteriaceae bacterium]|nr:GAF domain-containing protein [Bacteroidota bacterium]MDA9551460.1 GAF domain-containing protein [Flavobacteriaceae bacterium]MDB2472005.1 GAF domain-containing protein [Flavobacteriaceae bacterium]MDB2612585.1 GAF domain-containing protein [Flavobacteriaceae bacterium]MDC0957174.1 GAF domain-containing protein [Flavobacteriaceae bacterium]
MILKNLKKEVIDIVNDQNNSVDDRLKCLCNLLKQRITYYDWVGFYFKNGEKNELKLGPYAGEPTDHTIIPFGKGICGQVAVSNEKFIVPDVSAEDNYIACSLSVKSEIVVPVFVNGVNVGQIDIDSESANPFSEKDEELLEFVCSQVSGILQLLTTP